MKKTIFILIVSLFLTQLVFSKNLKLKGTYWIAMDDKWDILYYNKDKQRLGATSGDIIYFGDNNRFYCLKGLLELIEKNIVEIDEYDNTTFGFYGEWKKNGNIVEVKYKLFPNKHCRAPNKGMSEEYLSELKKSERIKIRINKNQFKTKIIKRSSKEWRYFNEKELGLEVYDPIISNYFGKEHAVKSKKKHGIKKPMKAKVKFKDFGLCFSPDSKLLLTTNTANTLGDGIIRFEVFDSSNLRKIEK